jgi:hypothetical protein
LEQYLDAGGLQVETRGGNKVGQQALPGHELVQREDCDGGPKVAKQTFSFSLGAGKERKEEQFTPQRTQTKVRKILKTLPVFERMPRFQQLALARSGITLHGTADQALFDFWLLPIPKRYDHS